VLWMSSSRTEGRSEAWMSDTKLSQVRPGLAQEMLDESTAQRLQRARAHLPEVALRVDGLQEERLLGAEAPDHEGRIHPGRRRDGAHADPVEAVLGEEGFADPLVR
jgi:hypothetical protein